ncbi:MULTISPECIES: CopG family transcriptional regulator [unclassified Rhodanobacter]|uniref:CopG family transcriptional regulator n=1 Tax=Rhodanobacter humi TaxID=1888173 RepID=A0ABV4AKL5_9GAMM
MATTTIRLPNALKSRVTTAAKQMGTTPHGFILEAIAEKAELAERRAGFDAGAEQRYDHIVATGKTISWNTMRAYLEGKAAGKVVRRPTPRRLSK